MLGYARLSPRNHVLGETGAGSPTSKGTIGRRASVQLCRWSTYLFAAMRTLAASSVATYSKLRPNICPRLWSKFVEL